MNGLTKRQREVLDFITTFIGKHSYAPSLAEIGEAMHLSALATVHKHVTNLTEKGYLRRRWGRSRSIEIVVKHDGCCPTCGRPINIEASASVVPA